MEWNHQLVGRTILVRGLISSRKGLEWSNKSGASYNRKSSLQDLPGEQVGELGNILRN